MQNESTSLILHRGSGWLSGTVGAAPIAQKTRLGTLARGTLQPGVYRIFKAWGEHSARGIIAILRSGERAFVIEGGHTGSGARAVIIEGGRGGERSIIIEGVRSPGAHRSIIIEGGRGGSTRGFVIEGGRGASDNAIIIEGGLDWLTSLESGTLQVVG